MFAHLVNFSIQNRGLICLLTVSVALYGLISLRDLPIDAVPDITNNQVQINTEFPALSPEEIEKQITFPVEFSLAGIQGLEYTRSISRNGFCQVTAVFRDNVDIYYARQQVLERLTEAKEVLPPGAEPALGPISTGLGEVYMYIVEYAEHAGATPRRDGEQGWQKDGSYLTPEGEYLAADYEQAAYLRTVQDWIVTPQLRGVEGVAGVDAIGGYEKQYHVQPDSLKLMAYGLTFHDVLEALEKNNNAIGANYIEHRGEQFIVRADGRVRSSAEVSEIVVGAHQGAPIHLRDVAEVGIGRELRTGAATENGKEVVVGTALMLIGENSRAVALAVDEKIREIRKSLPAGIEIRTVLNRSALVDATIATVRNNLMEGAILVIVILFLMLGNLRAAIIAALAIPLSMLFAAIGMTRFGISGNLMSLGAIDFGIIIDSSVIIVENCMRVLAERQHQQGRLLSLRERMNAVFEATKEMIGPSVFGRAIVITVHLPILALSGVEGRMFHPMALTVIFALIGAFILSLTFVPAMLALLLRGKVAERENVLLRSAKTVYQPVLAAALRLRWAVFMLAIVMIFASFLLFRQLGQVFIPSLDEGDLSIQSLRMPSTGISQSSAMQQMIERKLAEFPEIAFMFSKTGTAEVASDPMPPNISDGFIILKPREEWPNPRETKAEFVERLEQALETLPGQLYEFSQPIEMRFNELLAGVRGEVVIKIFGDEFETLNQIANQLGAIARNVPGASDVKLEQTAGLPFLDIQLDRLAIARYGLNIADVQEIIAIAIGGQEAGQIFQGDARFDIIVRLPDEIRSDFEQIKNIPVPLPPREDDHAIQLASLNTDLFPAPNVVPLNALAQLKFLEGPNQISRENGKRRTWVAINIRGRDLGSFVDELKQTVEQQYKLPPGYFLEWGGQYENLSRARARLGIVVPACFFLIFLLLYSNFQSLKYSLLVFSAVPFALTGGIVSLWLRDMPFSISASVGFIAVSGVAVMNGLVLVTYINQLLSHGHSLQDSIFQGALTRLRPVLMTALVDSLGFLPMALATGRGAEVQKPLATVVIGGIVTSTVLTLVILPALYRLWHREQIRNE